MVEMAGSWHALPGARAHKSVLWFASVKCGNVLLYSEEQSTYVFIVNSKQRYNDKDRQSFVFIYYLFDKKKVGGGGLCRSFQKNSWFILCPCTLRSRLHGFPRLIGPTISIPAITTKPVVVLGVLTMLLHRLL